MPVEWNGKKKEEETLDSLQIDRPLHNANWFIACYTSLNETFMIKELQCSLQEK